MTFVFLALTSTMFCACAGIQPTIEATIDCSDPSAPCLLPTTAQVESAILNTATPFVPEPTLLPRVVAEDAKQAYDNGKAIFIDVRSEGQFEQSHIPGALNIPLAALETRYTELDEHTWIITYCT